MSKKHDFASRIVWTGNRGDGTRDYRGYDRTWEIHTQGKEVIRCSNDPLLGGDPLKPNPEDLLISALSACHMLWYLHLASEAGIVVVKYQDTAIGHGETDRHGAGRFLAATLRPVVHVESGVDLSKADALHHEVPKYCFIARSVNFPVSYEATYHRG